MSRVAVVGGGPAAVSAAWPLAEAGVEVLLLEPGLEGPPRDQPGSFADHRRRPDQWRLLLGRPGEAASARGHASPKLTMPGHAFAFAGFAEAYRLRARGFAAVGSLASGGLSNVWGAGACFFGPDDLAELPLEPAELALSRRRVAARVGLSGADDGLAAHQGPGLELQPPVEPGPVAGRLLAAHLARPGPAARRGVALGLARNAVLTQPAGERLGCNYCNWCLWGCPRGSIYNAAPELAELARRPGVERRRVLVQGLARREGGWRLWGRGPEGEAWSGRAERVVLAAGALGTTALALDALGARGRWVRLLSNPALSFLLWQPALLGRGLEERGFALSQLSFTVGGPEMPEPVSGNLFSVDGLLASRLAAEVPLSRPSAVRTIRLLAPSLLLGLAMLPGAVTDSRLRLAPGQGLGPLEIRGGYRPAAGWLAARAGRRLRAGLAAYGAWVLPGSLGLAEPGADTHYAGALPMRRRPGELETSPAGEITGLPGVHAADASVLPRLPGKSHTLTSMAVADAIGRRLAEELA